MYSCWIPRLQRPPAILTTPHFHSSVLKQTHRTRGSGLGPKPKCWPAPPAHSELWIVRKERKTKKKIHSHSTIMIHRPDLWQVWCFHQGQANIAREKSLWRHLSKVFRLAWAPFKASGWNQSVMKAVVKFAFLLDDRLKVEVIYLD